MGPTVYLTIQFLILGHQPFIVDDVKQDSIEVCLKRASDILVKASEIHAGDETYEISAACSLSRDSEQPVDSKP
jgi:hypothetical protein